MLESPRCLMHLPRQKHWLPTIAPYVWPQPRARCIRFGGSAMPQIKLGIAVLRKIVSQLLFERLRISHHVLHLSVNVLSENGNRTGLRFSRSASVRDVPSPVQICEQSVISEIATVRCGKSVLLRFRSLLKAWVGSRAQLFPSVSANE